MSCEVLSGAAKAAGFSRRVIGSFAVNAAVGAAFLAQDTLPLCMQLSCTCSQ